MVQFAAGQCLRSGELCVLRFVNRLIVLIPLPLLQIRVGAARRIIFRRVIVVIRPTAVTCVNMMIQDAKTVRRMMERIGKTAEI
jgi:hypothetical protein